MKVAERIMSTITICIVICFLLFCLVVVTSIHPRDTSIKAREATLRANLSSLRWSINCFHENTGKYPVTLYDLLAADESEVKTDIPPHSYRGPYLHLYREDVLHGLPYNNFAIDDATGAYYPEIDKHWTYNPRTGEVRSAITGTTHDGKQYTEF